MKPASIRARLIQFYEICLSIDLGLEGYLISTPYLSAILHSTLVLCQKNFQTYLKILQITPLPHPLVKERGSKKRIPFRICVVLFRSAFYCSARNSFNIILLQAQEKYCYGDCYKDTARAEHRISVVYLVV